MASPSPIVARDEAESTPEPEVKSVAEPETVTRPEPALGAAQAQVPTPLAAAQPPESIGAAIAADGIALGGRVPGSYLPPSTVHRPVQEITRSSIGATAAAAVALPASAPGPAAAGLPSTQTPGPGRVPPGPIGAGKPATPGRASFLADLPFDAPERIEGWLAALGGGLAIIGFFLPWRSTFMTGIDGYFDSWGLGIGAHLPVFLALAAVTALAVLPNRVASWIRTGVCGMVLGGVLLGLVWLYLDGGASELGALLAAIGAVFLIAGGVIAVAPGRVSGPREDA